LKLTARHARGHVGVCWHDDDLLLSVVLSLALAEVLSLLGCGILVALVKVLDDLRVELLNLLL
jgi:hypothetical protein